MDTLEAFKNKGYISIAEDEEMQLEKANKRAEVAEKRANASDAEIARLCELLRKNGIDFTV